MIQATAKAFASTNNVDVACDDYASFGRFCDRDDPFHVLAQEGELTRHDKRCQQLRFPTGTRQPEAFLVGHFQVVLIVHKSNSIASLDFAGIRKAFGQDEKAANWQDVGGRAATIHCFGPCEKTHAYRFLQEKCMTSWENTETPGLRQQRRHAYRQDLVLCTGVQEVIAKVRGDRGGLGFFAWNESLTEQDVHGVKVVPIATTEGAPPVVPSLGPVIQKDYPLAEPISLYVHPTAPEVARDFCRYCVGEKGAALAAEHGLLTAYREQQYVYKQRLAELKAGKGVRVAVCGLAGEEALARDLALDFATAKAAVQMKYQSEISLADVVPSFLERGELLLAEGAVDIRNA